MPPAGLEPLEAMGFQPTRHAARVVLFTPPSESPRSHMFLSVPVEGVTYIVDPGFGPFAPQFPVPLADGDTTRTHWPFLRDRRIDAYGDLTKRFIDSTS